MAITKRGSRIGKNAGISVLYLKGITLKAARKLLVEKQILFEKILNNGLVHTSGLRSSFLYVRVLVCIAMTLKSKPKLKTPMQGKRFATIGEIKEKSKQEPLAIPKSVSRIGKNAGISVLYLKLVISKAAR